MEHWCKSNTKTPDDLDQPFISNHEIIYKDEFDDEEDADDYSNKFRFFVTTQRLLSFISLTNKIHVDATYKLIWQVFLV